MSIKKAIDVTKPVFFNFVGGNFCLRTRPQDFIELIPVGLVDPGLGIGIEEEANATRIGGQNKWGFAKQSHRLQYDVFLPEDLTLDFKIFAG